MICAIGDALLDVVVRLAGPIAEDTDTDGRTRVGPGGQAANVVAWVAALGGSSRFLGVRADDAAGRLVQGELCAARRGAGGTGGRRGNGDGRLDRASRRAPHDAHRPRRGADLRPGRPRPDVARRLHDPARPGVLARPRADRLDGEGRGAHRAGERRAREPRPLRDRGTRARSASRRSGSSWRSSRPDVVLGNEDEHELAGPLDAPTVVVKRGRARASRCGRATRSGTTRPAPRRSWTRPAPATRSRPGSSSTGSTSASRRRHAASRVWEPSPR